MKVIIFNIDFLHYFYHETEDTDKMEKYNHKLIPNAY